MSLTSQLSNPESPVSKFFAEYADAASAERIVRQFNFQLSGSQIFTTEGTEPALAGTAFDYLFRWTVAPLEADELVAMRGAKKVNDERTVREVVALGHNDPKMRPRCAVILAWFEGIFRGHEFPKPFKDWLEADKPVDDLFKVLPLATVSDITSLAENIPVAWKGIDIAGLAWAGKYIPNPVFAGSGDVGGADADWIIDGVLYDCKCTRKRYNAFTIDHLWQVLGYVLLDYSDEYNLFGIGWYFARQRKRLFITLEEAIAKCFWCPDLEYLREAFKNAVAAPKTAMPTNELEMMRWLDSLDMDLDFKSVYDLP